jgi:polygalacturonase
MGDGPGGGLNVRDCGAVGDGSDAVHRVDPARDRSLRQSGGGTVLVPVGRIRHRLALDAQHVTLHLDSGARLLGSQNAADYPVWVSRWEGNSQPAYAALISGEGLNNVAVTGRGTIDGRGSSGGTSSAGNAEIRAAPSAAAGRLPRRSHRTALTCVNAGFWTLNPTACDNVVISRVTVRNPPDSPNTDGINPDACSNVRISDCHIDVGDDCLTLKSGSEDDRRASPRAPARTSPSPTAPCCAATAAWWSEAR